MAGFFLGRLLAFGLCEHRQVLTVLPEHAKATELSSRFGVDCALNTVFGQMRFFNQQHVFVPSESVAVFVRRGRASSGVGVREVALDRRDLLKGGTSSTLVAAASLRGGWPNSNTGISGISA
jgi:hypothetical protein